MTLLVLLPAGQRPLLSNDLHLLLFLDDRDFKDRVDIDCYALLPWTIALASSKSPAWTSFTISAYLLFPEDGLAFGCVEESPALSLVWLAQERAPARRMWLPGLDTGEGAIGPNDSSDSSNP